MTVIGIDVSKDKLDCLWIRDLAHKKVKSKVLTNSPQGHQALITWAQRLTGQAIHEVLFVMEATGVYHEALAHHLHAAGAKVAVINPAQVKDYAKGLGVRTKTDKKDSLVLARFGLAESPRLWQPEPPEIRHLKALLARLQALEQDRQREANRLEKVQSNHNAEEVIASIKAMLRALEKQRAHIEALIDQHIDSHPGLKQDRGFLNSIKGIGPVLSRVMLAVIRSRDFTRATQLAAFLGLVPVERQSGSSVKGRPALSKTGDGRVRAKLYMGAIVAIRHNPDIKALYQRLLKRGKTKMSALGAAMRKLVHICFGVLKHQTPYQAQTPNARA